MKKSTLSMVAILAMSTMAFAGGDAGKNVMEAMEPTISIPEESNLGAFYLGLGYSYIQGNENIYDGYAYTADYDFDANGVLFQAGYKFNDYIAIEGRYTLSAGDITANDNLPNTNTPGDRDIDADISNMAIYLKPMYSIGDLSVYALLGYGQVTIDNNVDDTSWDDSGFQWGLGASYAFNDNLAAFADYVRWYDDSETFDIAGKRERNLDAISVGLSYTF